MPLLYHSPWRPTLLQLVECAALPDEGLGVPLRVQGVAVHGSAVPSALFLTLWDAITMVPLGKSVSQRWYKTVDDPRSRFAQLQPDRVRVVALDEAETTIWKGEAVEMAARKRKNVEGRRGGRGRGKGKGRGRPAKGLAPLGDAAPVVDCEPPAAGEADAESGDDDLIEDELPSDDDDEDDDDGDGSATDDNPFGFESEFEAAEGAVDPDDVAEGDGTSSSSTSSSSSSSSSGSAADGVDAAPSAASDGTGGVPRGYLSVPMPALAWKSGIRRTRIGVRKELYATCGIPGHGSCVRTKTANAGPKKGQGRPLGFLSAWLLAGKDCGTKDDHMRYKVTLKQRQEGRTLLALLPGSEDFFAFEADKKNDADPDEPVEFTQA